MKKVYKKVHLAAKLIIALIVTILISVAQITVLPYSILINGLAVFIWFFGVNPTAYLIEELYKIKHKHDIL